MFVFNGIRPAETCSAALLLSVLLALSCPAAFSATADAPPAVLQFEQNDSTLNPESAMKTGTLPPGSRYCGRAYHVSDQGLQVVNNPR